MIANAIENPDDSFLLRWFGHVVGVRPELPGGGGGLGGVPRRSRRRGRECRHRAEAVGHAGSRPRRGAEGRSRSASHRRDAGRVFPGAGRGAGRAGQRADHRGGDDQRHHALGRTAGDELAARGRVALVRGAAGREGRSMGLPRARRGRAAGRPRVLPGDQHFGTSARGACRCCPPWPDTGSASPRTRSSPPCPTIPRIFPRRST